MRRRYGFGRVGPALLWAALWVLTAGCTADVHNPARPDAGADGAKVDSGIDGASDVAGQPEASPDAPRAELPEDTTGADDGVAVDVPGPSDTVDDINDEGGAEVAVDAGPEVDVPAGWDPLCTTFDEFGEPNCRDQATLFQCGADAPPASSPARIRRLQRDEVVRASGLGILMSPGGYNLNPIKNNPLNTPSTARYSTYAEGVTVDSVSLDLLLQVIEQPGLGWVSKDAPLRMGPVYTDSGYNCIFDDDVPDVACRDYWLSGFIQHGLLFREATPVEWTRLATLLDDALAAEASTGASRQETLQQVVSSAWLMPSALFRQEIGADEADADGRHRLTDAELGKALSYLLTDRGPGAPVKFAFQCCDGDSWAVPPNEGYLADIRAAVDDGSIQQPAKVDALLRANVGGLDSIRRDLANEHNPSGVGSYRDNRGDYWLAPKVAAFFREWLDYGDFPTVFKDTPNATSPYMEGDTSLPGFNDYHANASYLNLQNAFYSHYNGKEATMVQQLDDLIARVVYEDVDVLKTLLTTRKYYIPSTGHGEACIADGECGGNGSCIDGLCYSSTAGGTRWVALPYGVDTPVPPNDDARWQDMPANERAGVLTHPAWLAAHGDAFEDGPSAILRGKWMRENLLCEYIPPLSKVQGVIAMLGESSPELSARDRVTAATMQPFCWQCHRRMNTLGMAFEMYNHAGYPRAWDHSATGPNNRGPVDGSTVIGGVGLESDPLGDGLDDLSDPSLHGAYASPIEMVEAMANSNVIKRCFVRQAFRFFAGRDETLADACTLEAMETAYDEKGSFIDMLSALAVSDTMLYRTQDDAAVCE